jgi:hypothetical protein
MLVINVSHPPYYYPTKLDGEKKLCQKEVKVTLTLIETDAAVP